MFETTPLRRPRHGTLPTPRMVMPSASTSPTTADTLVVPRSRPTTISGEASGVLMVCPWGSRIGKPTAGSGTAMLQNWAATACARRCHARFHGANFSRAFSASFEPHHDALRVRLVVEEDHSRRAALAGDLLE